MKKLLPLLFISILFYSCGGSDEDDSRRASNAETIYSPSERTREDFDYEYKIDEYGPVPPETENFMMGGNCVPPNLKLDIKVNRDYCKSDDCLIYFAGYWWWTNYQYTGKPNWFWNQGQSWSPRNAYVDNEGMHLTVKKDNLGGGNEWMASEVVAVFKGDKNTLAKTGYGTYLVSAKIKSAATFDQLDKNVAFGLFTFQNDKTGPPKNIYRELDLAEVSRWGTPPNSNVSDPRLATGNSQFAIQQWNLYAPNLHRYTINPSASEITLVMKWTNAKSPVSFYQYDGKYNLDNLPAQPSNTWTTGADQNEFIPDAACQLFHMNLWMGNYGQGDKHPGPSNGQNQEVVVTNFQYR